MTPRAEATYARNESLHYRRFPAFSYSRSTA